MGTRGRESASNIAVIGPTGIETLRRQRNSPHAGMQHILAESPTALLLRLAHGAGEVLTALCGRPRRRRILSSSDASSSSSHVPMNVAKPSRMASRSWSRATATPPCRWLWGSLSFRNLSKRPRLHPRNNSTIAATSAIAREKCRGELGGLREFVNALRSLKTCNFSVPENS